MTEIQEGSKEAAASDILHSDLSASIDWLFSEGMKALDDGELTEAKVRFDEAREAHWALQRTWTKEAGARAGVSGSRSKRPAATHPVLQTLDNARHRIPFWWWLTYDALVALVIVAGISPSDPAFWLGFAVLFIAVVIDTVEFIVKRPSAAAVLRPPTPEGEQ